MELARPPLTRWTAELVDRGQEQRFRDYILVSQRRTAVVTLAAILLVNAIAFGFSLLAGTDAAPGVLRSITQVAGTAVGVILVLALAGQRRQARLRHLVAGSVLMLTAFVAVMLATGPRMGFRGAIMVVGGVAVIYLTVPLRLTAVTVLSLVYSAVTVPIWLTVALADSAVDVLYTMMVLALAHVLGFAEARRAQRERRVLFAQRETLLALSSIDPLTGLMNRRAADAELKQAFARWRRHGQPLTLLMVDIDHFKTLNDSQGHVAGDHALRLVADVIRSVMPMIPGQVAARYGGEEFICLLPGQDAAQATVIAGRILAGVRRIAIPLTAGSAERSILTVSAGVAAVGPRISGPEELVDAADRQLYRAKGEGRNCVRTEPAGLTA